MSFRQLQNFVHWGRKIIGVGRNYKDHCTELQNPVPSKPVIFMKPPSSYLTEDNGPILIPYGCSDLNHEVELGIVIQSQCRDVSNEDAPSHVGGYVLLLDMTARDFQAYAKQNGLPWTLAKGFDTSLPLSRFIGPDEIPDPSNVELWLKVNGILRQKDSTSNMLHSIPSLISFISKYITLEAGDLILTGTPAGVATVVDGDTITCGITNLLECSFNVKKR